MVYPELEGELTVGGIYIKHFLKDPTFDLADPLSFLEQLLHKWFADIEVTDLSAWLFETGVGVDC